MILVARYSFLHKILSGKSNSIKMADRMAKIAKISTDLMKSTEILQLLNNPPPALINRDPVPPAKPPGGSVFIYDRGALALKDLSS